jgi:hypothetical protein
MVLVRIKSLAYHSVLYSWLLGSFYEWVLCELFSAITATSKENDL